MTKTTRAIEEEIRNRENTALGNAPIGSPSTSYMSEDEKNDYRRMRIRQINQDEGFMAKRQWTDEQRAAFGAKMKAARLAKQGLGAKPMARRGRKAKTGMSVSEAKARRDEAKALISAMTPAERKSLRSGSPRKRRSNRGLLDRLLSSVSVKRRAGRPKGKGKKMPRGKKGKSAKTFVQVEGSLPMQAVIEGSEALFTLGSVAVDIYTASTKSTADDTAFPIIARVMQSAARFGAVKFLGGRSPELASAISHGMSAANGDRNGNFIRNHLRRFLQPVTP